MIKPHTLAPDSGSSGAGGHCQPRSIFLWPGAGYCPGPFAHISASSLVWLIAIHDLTSDSRISAGARRSRADLARSVVTAEAATLELSTCSSTGQCHTPLICFQPARVIVVSQTFVACGTGRILFIVVLLNRNLLAISFCGFHGSCGPQGR